MDVRDALAWLDDLWASSLGPRATSTAPPTIRRRLLIGSLEPRPPSQRYFQRAHGVRGPATVPAFGVSAFRNEPRT